MFQSHQTQVVLQLNRCSLMLGQPVSVPAGVSVPERITWPGPSVLTVSSQWATTQIQQSAVCRPRSGSTHRTSRAHHGDSCCSSEHIAAPHVLTSNTWRVQPDRQVMTFSVDQFTTWLDISCSLETNERGNLKETLLHVKATLYIVLFGGGLCRKWVTWVNSAWALSSGGE